MDKNLNDLRDLLLQGIRLSKQSSYCRRYPHMHSLPYFEEVRGGLREILKNNPSNTEAWSLLSQTEECLINYESAAKCLENVIMLKKSTTKKDIKRLAQLKIYSAEWRNLMLTPAQLQDLGMFLDESGAMHEHMGRTLQFTRQWLERESIDAPITVLEALGKRGGFTDFEVFWNVVHG